jgi:micrococcal nuclease
MTLPTRRRSAASATIVVAVVLCALSALARDSDAQPARVSSVVDGDTIRVELAESPITVRLIGVDTPEMHDRHDISAPPQPFAREASDFARRTLAGQRVRLEFEPGNRLDRYGRTLAYVFLGDGTFFNRELVRQGYARAYTRFPFRYREQFRADETLARSQGRGLWAQVASAPQGPVIGNRVSRLYHLPGQEHYGDVAERNRVYFESEAAARAAGFEPARR